MPYKVQLEDGFHFILGLIVGCLSVCLVFIFTFDSQMTLVAASVGVILSFILSIITWKDNRFEAHNLMLGVLFATFLLLLVSGILVQVGVFRHL